MQVMARGQNEVQSRSFSDYVDGGYEFVLGLDLSSKVETLGREAVDLLKAPQCPGGVTDLIQGGEMVALQIHESCGHPVELDRVLGQEATYAGTSFLTPEKKGNYKYGSPRSILCLRHPPRGLGTWFDDDGVEAQRRSGG